MSGAGPSSPDGANNINNNAGGSGGGGKDQGPLDRVASDGGKFFKSQEQKDALEEAYTSAFLVVERERERERREGDDSFFSSSIASSSDHLVASHDRTKKQNFPPTPQKKTTKQKTPTRTWRLASASRPTSACPRRPAPRGSSGAGR